MLNMLILEILHTYTDEEHSLTQQEILKLLEKNYGMECDRRSVKNNVLYLKELGYDISMEKAIGYFQGDLMMPSFASLLIAFCFQNLYLHDRQRILLRNFAYLRAIISRQRFPT